MDHADEDGLCPQRQLDAVARQLQVDDEAGLDELERLLGRWPLDPRLHFLRGSVLAGLQRYGEGRDAMARAIEIAPDFALARFQLGFLDFTSGRAIQAVGVWNPLGLLPADEPLRLFAEGLARLAGDDFAEARRLLGQGMACNREHPLLNADMQLILDELDRLPGRQAAAGEEPGDIGEPGPASAAQLLLQQARMKNDTCH